MGLKGNIIIGQNIIAGVKFEAGDYGVPVTLGAGDGVYLVSHSLTQTADLSKSTHFAGITANSPIKRAEIIEGTLTLEPRYNDLRLLVAAVGLTPPGFSPIGSYAHYVEPSAINTRTPDYFDTAETAPTVLRNRFTYLVGTENKAYQVEGCFATGFSLQMDFNTQRLTVPFAGRFLSIDDDANPDIDDLTLPDSDLINLKDAKVYVKTLDGLELSASKTLDVSDSGGSTSITLPAGKYSCSRIASYFSTALNRNSTLNGNYRVFYDFELRRFIFESDESSSILGTGTINDSIGYTSASTSKTRHVGDSAPEIYWTGFLPTDLLGVSAVSVEYVRNDRREMSAFSYLGIDEPIRGDDSLRVTLTMPRYSGDFLIQEGNSGGSFSIQIRFSKTKIFNLYIPCAYISSVDTPISGPGVASVTITFEAMLNRSLFDPFVMSTVSSFTWREASKGLSVNDSVLAVGSYNDRLHIGGENSGTPFFKRISENAISSDLGSYGGTYGSPRSMIEHRGKLYISDATGNVASWDGSTLSSVYASVSGHFKRMISWNGKLYGIESTTGYLKSYDGTSWTTENTFGGSTAGYDICAYNGYIYCLIKKSSTTRLYKFIVGTGASEIHDFGGDYTNAHMCRFDQKVWAVANTALLGYDGTTKNSKTVSENMADMIEYNGHLVFLPVDKTSGAKFFDFANNADDSFSSAFSSSIQGRSVKINNKIIFPADDLIICYSGIPSFFLRITNDISSNPLYAAIP